MGRDVDGGGSPGEGEQSSPRTCSQVGFAVNIIMLLSRVVDCDQECFATFLADLDHCDNDGVLDQLIMPMATMLIKTTPGWRELRKSLVTRRGLRI